MTIHAVGYHFGAQDEPFACPALRARLEGRLEESFRAKPGHMTRAKVEKLLF